jgi:spermidine synthase
VLGNSQYAVATVVSAYLAGLALGAWTAGRVPALVRRPLVTYGALEAGIGLFGLVSLALLAVLEPAIAAAARTFTPGSAPFVLVRFLASSAVPRPHVLMGATLQYSSTGRRGDGPPGGVLSRLHCVIRSARLGTLLAGFVLMPAISCRGPRAWRAHEPHPLRLVAIAFRRKPTRPGAERSPKPRKPNPPRPTTPRRPCEGASRPRSSSSQGPVALTLESAGRGSPRAVRLVGHSFALVSRLPGRDRARRSRDRALQRARSAGPVRGRGGCHAELSSRAWRRSVGVRRALLASQGNGTLWLREGRARRLRIPAAAASARCSQSRPAFSRKGRAGGAADRATLLVNTLGTVAGMAAGFWPCPRSGSSPPDGCGGPAAVLGMTRAVAPVRRPRSAGPRGPRSPGARAWRLMPSRDCARWLD